MAGPAALVGCFLALLVWDLVHIARELNRGRDALDEVTLAAVSEVGLVGLADDAAAHLDRANGRAARSLPLRLISGFPILHDQVEGLRDLTTVTAELGASGAAAARRIDPELARAGEPAGRISLLDVTLDEIDRLRREVDAIDLGPSDGLVPPLRDARADLAASIARASAKLEEGRALVEPVRTMLVGPTTYLLLAANNAEMAGGAGLALSAGALTMEDGHIEIGEVVAADRLRLDTPVPLTEDLDAVYRPTGVGIDFRSTTRSPNLPVMGPLAVAMSGALGFPGLDGVLVVDALALERVLSVTGGVTVEGERIDADNVLEKVLHENYQSFDERQDRVSFQGEIAKAVFASLTDRDVAAADLAAAIVDAAKGRHVLAWSDQPALQAVWAELGMTGALDPRGLLISFQNYGANKMDWYLRPQASMQVSDLPSGDYRARLTLTMAVPARDEIPDASPFIIGEDPDHHSVFLTVHLPAAAFDITTPDTAGFTTAGLDPPMQVRTFIREVPVGTTLEQHLDFSLPRDQPWLLLLPSARMVPLPLSINGAEPITDAEPTWTTWIDLGVDDTAPWLRAIVAVGLLATVVASGSLSVAVNGPSHHQTTRRRRLRVARDASVTALACLAAAAVLAAVF